MVDEAYYEEKLDHNLDKMVSKTFQIEKVKAFALTKPRLIGDIGLRAFVQLYKKAKAIIQKQKIDFVYIPIPSFYTALIGRWLHSSTKVLYGIDYIDPWVHPFPKGKQFFSRHWFSEKIANWLEPIAVKKASLITGVAEGYFEGVKKRNPHLLKQAVFGAMPYGAEKEDHEGISTLDIKPYLFRVNPEKIQLVYAGAMLPKAYTPLEKVFSAIKKEPDIFKRLEIHFIGTGKSNTDPGGFNIKPLAVEYNLWQTNVFEYPARIPYLDVLVHLNAASGVFILGSTEPHYTPSKVYQGVLSKKPILAVLHTESTAVKVLQRSKAGIVLDFSGEKDTDKIEKSFGEVYKEYETYHRHFNPEAVNQEEFERFSAKECTRQLTELLAAVHAPISPQSR